MKDKRLKYVLFPLVLGIWSFALYKYLFWTPEEPGVASSDVGNSALVAPEVLVDDTFDLLPAYRDPFLGGMPAVTARFEGSTAAVPQGSGGPPRQAAPAAKDYIPTMDWGVVRYNGWVQQSGKPGMDGLLTIAGKLHHVGPGSLVKGIEVKAMTADSIVLRFAEETKTIYKR